MDPVDLSPAGIAALRRIAEAATPGPWESVTILPAGEAISDFGERSSWGESPWRVVNGPPQCMSDDMLSRRAFTRTEDGTYIATFAPPTVLALLAEVERLRQSQRELTKQRDDAEYREEDALQEMRKARAALEEK